jgi:pentatricopeptide repeat protein
MIDIWYSMEHILFFPSPSPPLFPALMIIRTENFFSPLRKMVRRSPRRAVPRVEHTVGRRPTLPRRHYMFLKQGTLPLAIEDLSVKRPSVFDESKIEQSLKQVSGRPEKIFGAPQTRKGTKIVEWKKSSATPPSLPPATMTPKQLGPANLAPSRLLDSPSSSPVPATSASLISMLREKAVMFGETGVNPDLLETIKNAVSNGLERDAQTKELAACTHTVETLLDQNLASVENFNLLIRANNFQKNFKQARDVFDAMTRLGYTPDESTYVALMCGVSAQSARETFLTMRSRAVSPTEKIYGALIKAHGRDISSGFALLEKMEDELISLTSPVIPTMLLDGLVKTGKIELARKKFSEFRSWKNIKPDAVMFTVMIKACRVNRECEQALSMLDDLRASDEYPTDITYTELIRVMSTRSDFAPKAFDFFRQMQAEGFELNTRIGVYLVRACAELGDLNKLRKTVTEIVNSGLPITPSVYTHSIRCIANSVREKGVSDFEKASHIRLAWHLVGGLREKLGKPVQPAVLNAVTQVYANAGFTDHALAMLDQFVKAEVVPNTHTYEILLEMFGMSVPSDPTRFFMIFDSHINELPPRILHLALDVALESKSAKRTVFVLETMEKRHVFPLPQQAEKLAQVGRKIVQIHQSVGKLVALQKSITHDTMVRENAVVQLQIQEHEVRLALDGKTTNDPTVEQEVREKFFNRQKSPKNPRLPRNEYLQIKKKGGVMHGKKIDKPTPSLVE